MKAENCPGKGRFPGQFVILIVIIILICQAGKTVAEFMNHDRAEQRMMGSCERVGIIYSPTTVIICICKDYNMFIGKSGQDIMQLVQPSNEDNCPRAICVVESVPEKI